MILNIVLKRVVPTLIIIFLALGVQADEVFKLSTKGGLKIESAQNNAWFSIGGRIMWDYDHTQTDTLTEDTLEIRRARLTFKGQTGNWGYKAQFNVAEEEAGTVEDLYIQYKGWGESSVLTFGHIREAFGLEDQTSSKDISLIERSAITELYGPGRTAGIQLSGVKDDLFYAVGIFRDDEDDAQSIAETAITGRIAYAAINENNRLVHLGASARMGDEDDLYVLELAGVLGSTHAQMEFFDANKANQDGIYLQVGHIITGEVRPYKKGAFKRVKPNDGMAIEVVARYEDGFGEYSNIGLGIGEGSQASLGVNLYPNNNVRLSFSYMSGDLDNGVDGDGEEFRFRTQFTF